MNYELPKLGFEENACEPFLSAESFSFHHGKHHKAYVDNLNKLIEGTEFEKMPLEQTIKQSFGKSVAIFNNAAQHWNHSFLWESLKPMLAKMQPTGVLKELINSSFGSVEVLIDEFQKAGLQQFGSGWAWLTYNKAEDKLLIEKTSNAETPITGNNIPLLACDVWEHAYYIDYRNRRSDYLKDIMHNLLNWEKAEERLKKQSSF